MTRHLGQACLLAITAAWGTTFVVMADMQASWLPWPLMAYRFGLGTAVLLPLLLVQRVSGGRRALQDGAFLGFFAFLGFALQTLAMRATSEAHCAFCTSLITVLVPLLSALKRRQAPSRSTLLAMACALTGMGLLLQGSDGPLADGSAVAASALGDGLAALGALAFSFQIVALEHLAEGQPLLPLLVAELGAVAVLSLMGMLAAGQRAPPFEAHSYALLAYLGVVASALCFLGQLWGQARTPATQAAFIFATEPLFAAALAWVLHGQAMLPSEMTGGALVFFSALVAEGPVAHLVNRRAAGH